MFEYSQGVQTGCCLYFQKTGNSVLCRVRLAINEEIVKKAGKNGIQIECISARLPKVRISIESNFVTFVVAYTPTEGAPERQNAKRMAALNSTVASVPAREYDIILTDANTMTGNIGEGGGEAGS